MVNLYIDNVTLQNFEMEGVNMTDTIVFTFNEMDKHISKSLNEMDTHIGNYMTPGTFHLITTLLIIVLTLMIVIQLLMIISKINCCKKNKPLLNEIERDRIDSYNRMRL